MCLILSMRGNLQAVSLRLGFMRVRWACGAVRFVVMTAPCLILIKVEIRKLGDS